MKPRGPRRAGVTILELLMAASLLGMVLVVAYSLLISGGRQQEIVVRHADLAGQTRSAVRRISKDVRAATEVLALARDGTRLERLTLAIPDPESVEFTRHIDYEYDAAGQVLTREGEPILGTEVRDLEAFAFDDLGQLIPDAAVRERVAFLRLRFSLGAADAPPAQRRKLDLTLTPRVPASKARADRDMLERAFERFEPPRPDPAPGTGDGGPRPRF